VIAGFRNFISRGNVVDLAVAVVIGAAFGAVVSSLVTDLITPLIGAIFGEPDFSGLTFTINGSEFTYGNFLNALISFLTIAAAIYFLVVAPMEKWQELRHGPKAAEKRPCPECLSEVPVPAKRCAFCTSELPPAETTAT
jgi:large conductance mechanosensitive channel